MDNNPLTWNVTIQILVMILTTGLVVAGLLLLWQRRRPVQVHVITHEVNKTFEEVVAQVKEQDKVEFQYTEVAKARLKEQGVV